MPSPPPMRRRAARLSPALPARLPARPQVEVVGCDGELQRVARSALTVRPNFAYTLPEVQADVKRVFSTGWFAEVVPDAQVRACVDRSGGPAAGWMGSKMGGRWWRAQQRGRRRAGT